MTILTHKIRIYPNKTMINQFNDWFNYSRYSYNAGLDLWNELYDEGEKPNERKVRDTYKSSRRKEWEKTLPPNILDNAIKDVASGWKMFFKGLCKKPKFKSKRKAKKSFTINRKDSYTIRIKNNRLYLPKAKYGVKLAELPRFKGVIKVATVTERAGMYWVSLSIELDKSNILYKASDDLGVVGVDANIGHFDISEEDHRWDTPLKDLNVLYNRINFYQRQLSRKVRGSNKYNAVRTKLRKTYLRIQNIQDDWLHKFTTYLVKNYKTICIEDLNVKGMLSNKLISRNIHRSLFYRFKIFLKYKCDLYDNKLAIADKWFPSTQTCSSCGCRKEGSDKLNLSDRKYICFDCGVVSNRDYNSACNLKIYAERDGLSLKT